VPPPRNRVKAIEKALESRVKQKPSEVDKGALSSKVFTLLEKGKTILQVAIALKIGRDQAKEFYDDWLALKNIDVNRAAVLKGLNTLENLAETEYSLCQTIDDILCALECNKYLFFQSKNKSAITNFEREFNTLTNQNFKTMGAIIKACKGLNPHLSASLLKKSMNLVGFHSLNAFIKEKESFKELGITEDDLKDLGAEELERTLEATPKDLEMLGLKTDAEK
jgi:hypothetical protein